MSKQPSTAYQASKLPGIILYEINKFIKHFQVRIWKLALENYLDIPSPLEHGWKASEGGLEPLWSKEEILPQEIIDIMNEGNDDDSNEDMIPESSDSDDSDSDLIDQTKIFSSLYKP